MFDPKLRARSAALLVVALAAVACGDGDGTSGNGDEPLTKVKLVLPSSPGSTDAAWLGGIEEGYFEEEGIDLEILPGEGFQFGMTAVATGTADFAMVDLPTIFLNKSQDPEMPVIGIGALQQQAIYAILSLASGSNVQTPEDLDGQEIYLSNTSSIRAIIDAWAKEIGAGGYEWRNVDIRTVGQLFLAKRIDTAMIPVTSSPEYVLEAAKEGEEVVILALKDYGMENFLGSMFVVNTDLADEDPELVRGWLRAATKSWQWLFENEEEAIDLLIDSYPTQDKEIGLARIAAYEEAATDDGKIPLEEFGTIQADKVEATLAWLRDAFDTDVDQDLLFTTEYLEE